MSEAIYNLFAPLLFNKKTTFNNGTRNAQILTKKKENYKHSKTDGERAHKFPLIDQIAAKLYAKSDLIAFNLCNFRRKSGV
jgi:hypothetical protein